MKRNGILIGLFVLFAVALAALRAAIAPPQSALDVRVSSVNAQPRGARAFYLWLREVGFAARSFREPLTSLGDEVAVLAVLEPSQSLTTKQADALFAWVEGGGTLWLAPGEDVEIETRLERYITLLDDDTRAGDIAGDRVVPDDGERWRYRRVEGAAAGAFVYPVDEVAFSGSDRVRDDRQEHSILFARDGHGIAAEIFAGDGLILLFPDASLLTNRGLAKADNIDLVASMLEEWVEPGAEIWFDEYDHGHRVAGSLLAYLAQRRPGLFALAFLVTAALATMRYGRALLRRDDQQAVRRRRPEEFVEALAAMYARAHATRPAWDALAKTGHALGEGRGSVAAWAARARISEKERTQRAGELQALASAYKNSDPPVHVKERDLRKLATSIARWVGPPESSERKQ